MAAIELNSTAIKGFVRASSNHADALGGSSSCPTFHIVATHPRVAAVETMTPIAAGTLARYVRRFRLKRSDALGREQGQALVRLFVSSGVVAYLLTSHIPLDLSNGLPGWLLFSTSFLGFSAAVAYLALRDKGPSRFRRIVTNVADIGAISYLMIATEQVGAPLSVLYLWVTLGNGFRFGLPALVVSALLSVAGFSAVFMLSPFWQTHPMFALGVVISLILLPVYVSHLIRQITQARERAEEASAAKSRFLARMSHELRTPLNGIVGTTQLLLAGKRLGREERSLLEVINDSVAVSLRQIDNVLDFSRIEAGKLSLEQVDFDLHELVNNAARMVRFAASDKSLRLVVRIDPATPFSLVGDPHHLREILLNLLSNAIKFTNEGYVALEVKLRAVAPERLVLRFEVHDTGIGIAPEALERVFDSFTQEDTSTTRRYGGTGLGTTIAKQLAELMGGRIGVSSIKGKGTVFWCELPFRGASGVPAPDRPPDGARVIFLAQTDDRTETISSILEPAGISLLRVRNHDEAAAALARSIRLGNPLLGILLDGVDPENGDTRGLSEKTLAAQVPLILLTDRILPEELQREAGIFAALPATPSFPLLWNALRASPAFRAERDRAVIQVEPWAWNARGNACRRALIADDNRTNLLILQKMLERANYEVDSVQDGEQALERLATGRYKVAVIDMHMPGMDGVDLIRQYRFLNPRSSLPIVVLTANATMEAKTECADAGADAYLTKPVSADLLLSTVDRLVDDHEVTDLNKRRPASSPGAPKASPDVLDLDLLSELDRMYVDPAAFRQVVESFETDGYRLLLQMRSASGARNHAGFCEALHALKGNAANMGALRLADVCQRAEGVGFVEFRQESGGLLAEVEACFLEALGELRGLTLSPGVLVRRRTTEA